MSEEAREGAPPPFSNGGVKNRSVAHHFNRWSAIHSPNLVCSCDRANCNFGLDWTKVRYIRQICIVIIRIYVASIGEVRNSRQKQGVDGWCQNRSFAHRSVKCVIVVKNKVVSKSLGRTSIGEVRTCRQKQGDYVEGCQKM